MQKDSLPPIYWYLFYTNSDVAEFLQQTVGEIQRLVSSHDNEIGMVFPQPFAFVPLGHHVEIITKCKFEYS